MVNRINQVYEQYWSYTAAKTDLNSRSFLDVLAGCVRFFNRKKEDQNYEGLQNEVAGIMGITPPSTRKMINQLVKLGFLMPNMGGYREETKEYLDAKTDKKRQSILSKVVYRYSNFNNSMTDPDFGGQGQINFFLRTLEEVGYISDKELVALMSINVNDYQRGYLTSEELSAIYQTAKKNGFVDRKYNQISHLKNLLGRLDDLVLHDGVLYFKTDAQKLFGEEEKASKSGRDSYLQRVFKSELEEESTIHYESEIPKCMLEGLSYPVLIASHIKPYIDSDETEAFDINNGLLLSKNFDSLFDLGYITFDDEGKIVTSKDLDSEVAEYSKSFKLDKDFVNPKRMKYMEYHRKYVFEKRYSRVARRQYSLIS